MTTKSTNHNLFSGVNCNWGFNGSINNNYQQDGPVNANGPIRTNAWPNPFNGGTLNEDALGVQNGFRAVFRAGQTTEQSIDMLDLDMRALEVLALNPATPAAVLEQIAQHPDADLRAILGENKNTPETTMRKLALDQDPDVRYQLAENPHIDPNLLVVLVMDDNPYVASRAQRTLSRVLAPI